MSDPKELLERARDSFGVDAQRPSDDVQSDQMSEQADQHVTAQQQQAPQQTPAPYQEPDYYDYYAPQPEQEVVRWVAPSRPFKKKNRKYFTTVFTIVLLLCLILFFAGQIPAVAVTIAVAFMSYVLSTIPPHDVLYQITTYGIRIEDNLYYWEELGRFWFVDRDDERIMHVEVSRFPNRLSLILRDVEEAELRELVGRVLLNEVPPLTYYERLALWMQQNLPLDLES